PLTLFALGCADEGEPWPIGIENAGMAASRNTFATPEGFSFYEAAPLDGGQWLVVDQQGMLTFLDAQRRVVARGDATDHVAALRSGGAPGDHVATSRSTAERVCTGLLCRHRATLSGRRKHRRAAPGPRRGRLAATGSVDDCPAWRPDSVVARADATAFGGRSRGDCCGSRCADRTL